MGEDKAGPCRVTCLGVVKHLQRDFPGPQGASPSRCQGNTFCSCRGQDVIILMHLFSVLGPSPHISTGSG